MADLEPGNLDAADIPDSVQDQARRLGIKLSAGEEPEAAASPKAEEARQEEIRPAPAASEPTPAPEPAAGPSEEIQKQAERYRELERRLENVERDYGASSKEARRLAERVRIADSKLASLKEKYSLEELNDWSPEPQAPEDRPITRREMDELEIQRHWRNAEETFFGSEKNADLASPRMRKWVIAGLFDDKGVLVHPNKTPREAFEASAQECRKILDAARLKGRQERDKVQEDIKRAAVAEGKSPPPKVEQPAPEEAPDENAYVTAARQHQQRMHSGRK